MTHREATLTIIEALARSVETKDAEIAEALRELWRRFSQPAVLH